MSIRIIAARWLGWCAGLAALLVQAQPLGPIITIPIEKVREPYLVLHEDGGGKACGVKLYGEWPAYRNYTNRTSYRIFTPGLQSTASPQNSVPPGGRFRFYCYFNGIDTGNLDAVCPDKIGEQHPDWYVEVQRRGPSASFTSKPRPPEPGQFEFASTSTDPEGELLIENWDFGDNTSGGGTSPIHRYTQPGSYSVRLTVTDTDALTNAATRTVTVPAPKPLVSVRLLSKHTGNRIELGEQFGVKVTIRATDDGVGALSGLAFTGTPLTVPGLFTIVNAPAETTIGSLQPGESREFEWTLRADLAGEFALTASAVTGKDAIGRNVSGASAAVRGEVTSLIVGITQHPARFVVGGDNNKDGETNALDRLVELVVGITNVSKQDVTGVKAAIPADPIQLTSKAEDLNIWLTPVSVPPGDFGTIRPGAANAVLRTNVYEATDRTYAEASILVQGKVGEAGVQARGEGLVSIGGETLVEARFDVEDRPYRSGQVVRLFGSLKNVSRFKDSRGEVIDEGKTVGVVIFPTIEGNGILGYAFLKGSGGRTPDGPTAFLLAPDEEIEISAIIPTAEQTTNTTLAVTYQVVGYVHGEGPKPRRTRPDEIEVVEEVTEGWSAHHEVELAGVPEIQDPWLTCPTELSIGGFVSCRFTEGLGNAGGSLAGLFMLTGAGLKEIGVGSVRLISWGIWALGQTLDGLEDPAARARLAQEVLIDLQALKQVGVESLQGVELAVESIGPAIERAIIDTGRTLETGDLKLIAGGMARITGENIDLPLEALIAARAVRKAMLVREGAQSAAKQALQESQERAARELGGTVDSYAARGALSDLPTSDDLPTGLNVVNEPRVYRDAYGSRREEVDAYLAVAKEEGLIMGWRSRSPISADKLDAGTHLLKPHGVSIKTVNEIDEKYLNFPSKFLGECVLVEPPIPWVKPWLDKKNKIPNPEFQAAADDYLGRFPELNLGTEESLGLREQVYGRLAHQMDEWPEQAEKFVKYSREGIDVNFHVQKQKGFGFGEFLLPNKQAKRAAQLEPDHFFDPFTGERRNTYRLLMDDGTGKFKPITGDTDFLFMLNPDGTMPSLLKRVRAYSKMIRLGLQHGESFSFSIKKLREGWLRCCTPRASGGEGEKMLAVTPYGELLTTQFRDALSVIEGGQNSALKISKGEFAFLEGTLTEVNTLERTASEAIPKAIRHEVVPLVTVSVLARMVDELEAEADRTGGRAVRMGPDGQPEVYDPAPATPPRALLAGALRAGGPRPAGNSPAEDALEADLAKLAAAGWVSVREVPPPGASGGQWRPATVEEARGGTAGAGLKLSPYTYLTNDVPAGATVLPVLPAAEVGWAGDGPLFAVGDQVVVDPGGPAEEFASVASVHPFTLSRPIEYLQEAGTMVLFLSGVAEPGQVPGALPAQENLLVWLRADAGLTVTNGTNVISWTDQSRNAFVFTAPTEATRPVWVANSTPGVPAVRFAAASTPRLQGDLGRTLTNATIFTLARWVDASSGSRYIYAFGTRDYSGLMMTLARRSGDQAYHYDGAAERVADGAVPGTGLRLFTQVYGEDGPDRHRLAVDLQTVLDTRTTVGRAYSAVATNVVLGNYVTGSYGFVGDLLEWLVYDRVLSVEERFEVEEYLRQRAGLAPFTTPGGIDLGSTEVLDFDVTPAPGVSWSLDSANRQLVQAGAGDPSLALAGFGESGQVIRTKFRAGAGPGSGALGVVFGFQDSGSFHLFDWRQTTGTDADWGTAPAGMRLRTFHLPAGQEPTGADLWSGQDPERVTTWRTNALPWVVGREYDVVIRFGEDQTVVEVACGASILETWAVPELEGVSGQFGYYAHTMSEARFGPAVWPGAAPLITGLDLGDDGQGAVHWLHGLPPFVVESTTGLSADAWEPVAPATLNRSRTIPAPDPTRFFRVRSAGVVPDGGDGGGDGRSQTFGNHGALWRVSGTGPVRIEAENFDEGGEGVGYHDTTSANQGGAYRAEGVDVGATTDFGGGHSVVSIAAGEWLEYTIRVEQGGAYWLRARTARGQSGNRALRFLINGEDKSGDVTVPATGGWAAYATVQSGALELAAGPQVLRVDLAGGGFDLNWIEIVPVVPVVQTTSGNGGLPWSIGSLTATRLEAENFDTGGEGVAYHETTPQNAGGAYRAEAVDILETGDSGGGHAVGWIAASEWLEYTIRVEQAGSYRLRARTARGASGARTVRFLFDGVDKTGSLVVPATGGWETYTTVESGRFELAAGEQVLRADMTSADFYLNWIELVPVVPVAQAAFGNDGNPWLVDPSTVVRIEAENFDQGGPDVAYRDADSINQTGAYRSEDVDVGPTTDVGGGFYVGAIEAGEWLEYTIDVPAAGTYQLRFRTARAPAGSSTLRVLVDGVDKTGNVTIPRTVGSQTWTTVTRAGVSLEAGIQRLRVEMVVGGFNLNWIEIGP